MKIATTIAKSMGLIGIWFMLNSLQTTVFGQDLSNVHCRLTPSNSEKSALLSMSNLDGKKVNLTIKDQNGSTVLNEEIEGKNHYASILNLSKLSPGQYTFSYAVEGVERSSKITVGDSTLVVLHPEKLSKYHKPLHCRITERKVDVFADNENTESLKIRIYDQAGNLVFSAKYKDDDASQQIKRLDLSKLAAGDYVIAVLKGKNTFTGQISIN